VLNVLSVGTTLTPVKPKNPTRLVLGLTKAVGVGN